MKAKHSRQKLGMFICANLSALRAWMTLNYSQEQGSQKVNQLLFV